MNESLRDRRGAEEAQLAGAEEAHVAGAEEGQLAGPDAKPALARVLAAVGGSDTAARLATLSGSDFTTLMLEVSRRRAARNTPADLLRRYRTDRFVRPADSSWHRLRQAEDLLADHIPPEFEVLTLAPLVPLATHSGLGPVSQYKIVTAIRACEVAADPTNGLALEAAVRRLAHRGRAAAAGGGSGASREDSGPGREAIGAGRDATVRLAAFQRVVRAQQVERAGNFAHFSLLGLVTAGRDDGGHRFERAAVLEHVRAIAEGLSAAGLPSVQLALTPLSAAGAAIADALPAELTGAPVTVGLDRDREAGRGYYRDLCFKINAGDGEPQEVGDGGFTDWTARLTASNKERLLISGIGIDRTAALMTVR